MTWSIVAKDHETGFLGVMVATCDLGVGGICPATRAAVGALSSQALPNPTWRHRGLELLNQGIAPQDAVLALVHADEGSAHRQLHMVDSHGRTAAHTGDRCIAWCGHVTDDAVSVAGNMLAGASVVEGTLAAYLANREMPFFERLLEAMCAGQDAGGDKRGRQSVGVLIQGRETLPRLDLRVDDHAEPLVELRRLYEIAKHGHIPFSRAFASELRPFGVTDRQQIQRFITAQSGKALTEIGDISADD
jgi:uncharacterized Ntn-hydrolase superfamily protein